MNQYLYETDEIIPQTKCYFCQIGWHDDCVRKDEVNGCMIVVEEDGCSCWACHGMFKKVNLK